MKNLLITFLLLITYSLSAQTATEYFETANEQAANKQFYKAIPTYKKAIALDSTNLEYQWMLSKAILKENVRDTHRTDVGVFEGLQILDNMISKGAKSIKIYEAIVKVNQYVLNDYYNRYKNFTPKKTASWQDDKTDTSEKMKFKEIAINAYSKMEESCNEILKMEVDQKFATTKLKYLKKPVFN